jgi:hypothetical protein
MPHISTPFTHALIFLDGIAVICLVVIFSLYLSQRRSRYRLPPGPRRLPIVGNFFDAPKKFAWKQYSEWASQYGAPWAPTTLRMALIRHLILLGDIISLTIFGQVIVVFNSLSSIKQVILHQPGAFSSRPSLKFNEMSRLPFVLIYLVTHRLRFLGPVCRIRSLHFCLTVSAGVNGGESWTSHSDLK